MYLWSEFLSPDPISRRGSHVRQNLKKVHPTEEKKSYTAAGSREHTCQLSWCWKWRVPGSSRAHKRMRIRYGRSAYRKAVTFGGSSTGTNKETHTGFILQFLHTYRHLYARRKPILGQLPVIILHTLPTPSSPML